MVQRNISDRVEEDAGSLDLRTFFTTLNYIIDIFCGYLLSSETELVNRLSVSSLYRKSNREFISFYIADLFTTWKIPIHSLEAKQLEDLRRSALVNERGRNSRDFDSWMEFSNTKEFVLSEHTRESAFTITTRSTTVYINSNFGSRYNKIRSIKYNYL